MTPSQRRRLDAVSRIASPCFGCLHENLVDAVSNARPYTDESCDALERLNQAANAERVRKGQEPTECIAPIQRSANSNSRTPGWWRTSIDKRWLTWRG